MPEALLVLADGSSYRGESTGVEGHADGEVVFNTSMTGYQEMLTDPSYAGQILVLTYPLIGNYGVDAAVEESASIQPTGLVVREAAHYVSHVRASGGLREYLRARGVVGIAGVDTRAVTRRIRQHGVMPGTITTHESANEALARVRAFPGYDDIDWVATVTTPGPRLFTGDPLEYVYQPSGGLHAGGNARARYAHAGEGPGKRVALVDGGVKQNIMRALAARGCEVHQFPASTRAEEILGLRPDGIVLSPGPGDPRLLEGMVGETRKLIGRAPMLGICLGHQVAARALGAGTFKLPFGHRGGNHPVKDLVSGRVSVTAQNHGYAVDAEGLDRAAYVSHVNLNDGTVEGIAMHSEPLMTIQYHSEACPGPLDSDGIFDRFLGMMAGAPGGVK